MNVLIIAQNLTIGRLLLSASKAHPGIENFKVVVFSGLEKIILTKIYGECAENIIVAKKTTQGDIAKLDVREGIEVKRGMNSHDFIRQKQRALLGTLENLASFSYEYIWIFNEFTFIGRLLRAVPSLKEKTIIFENANVKSGVTVLGKFKGKKGSYLRKEILSPILAAPMNNAKISRYFSYITLIFQFRELRTINYYFRRLFFRIFNVVTFSLLKNGSKSLEKFNDKSIILVALQVRYDSSLLMNVSFEEYCAALIEAVKTHMSHYPNNVIVVRPHPKDYTLGWLTFLRIAKKLFKEVYIDVGRIEAYRERDVSCLITYNSNITRHVIWKTKPDLVIKEIKKDLKLPAFDEPLDVIFPGIFS